MRFRDVPKFTQTSGYKVDIFMGELKDRIERDIREYGLELNPDFQRGHVWTEEQQTRFIEYILRGGSSGRDLYFNHQGWFRDWEGEYVCVDGLQRITAILKFLDNEIPAFGCYLKDYKDGIPHNIFFHWHVNDLTKRGDVLTWYIEMNEGGTPHTKEEIEKVKRMIKNE